MATNADDPQDPGTPASDPNSSNEGNDPTNGNEPKPPQGDEETQSPETPPAEGTPPAGDEPKAPDQVPEADRDLDWYKKAYGESTAEALRLKDKLDKMPVPPPPPAPTPEPPATGEDIPDPDKLYIKQMRDKDIDTAWRKVLDEYPQLGDTQGDSYKRFVQRASLMGKSILEDEKRYVEPSELYPMVVASLGLAKGDDADRLGAALKDGASNPRTSSGPARPPEQSKVTDAMIAANRRWYPDKTDAQIREELEPHVQEN